MGIKTTIAKTLHATSSVGEAPISQSNNRNEKQKTTVKAAVAIKSEKPFKRPTRQSTVGVASLCGAFTAKR